MARRSVDFPVPVLTDEKGHGPGKFYPVSLLKNFQVKRVTISDRKCIVEQTGAIEYAYPD